MKIKVLGSGQDAGIPQIGCHCNICEKARRYKRYRRFGPSIAIFDEQKGFCYLIDASPDFKYQLDMIRGQARKVKRKGKIPISAILLTHAHFGHYAGLLHFGIEAANTRNLPVFVTRRMKDFLSSNSPFKRLIENKNIKIKEIYPGKEVGLKGFKCIPIKVPHRDEISDTVGYIIESEKRVIYIPDVDHWTENLIKEITSTDIAFLDGTFYSKNEIGRFREVPHPPIKETLELLQNVKTEIYFTHINHTNPINRNGEERRYIKRRGFKIAYDGLEMKI